MKINMNQFKRFEKQIILKTIGFAGQKKIFSANVLVVGLGGLGCPLTTYLAASGVGKIGIVDFDKVEISNLTRQTLFNSWDLGKFKVNQVKKPLKGTFSAFLDVNKIRTYDHFYHAPICEDDPGKESYDFNTDINSTFRLIPGAFPEEDVNVIYQEELDKDSHDLRNPYYFYGNPKYIQNKMLYDDEIQDMFLKIKLEQPLHHEDDRHLVHDHQYEGTHD